MLSCSHERKTRGSQDNQGATTALSRHKNAPQPRSDSLTNEPTKRRCERFVGVCERGTARYFLQKEDEKNGVKSAVGILHGPGKFQAVMT